jgi:hypothetical protein
MNPNLPPVVSDSFALEAFKLSAVQFPSRMIQLLALMAEKVSVETALDALEGVGQDLESQLEDATGQTAQDLQSLCVACAYEGSEALGRLARALPFVWSATSLCKAMFEGLADAANSWGEGPEFAKACSQAAFDWLPKGLAPAAWVALAQQGGPAWRAFKIDHGADGRDEPLAQPDASTLQWLSHKPAARLAKTLGCSQYGLHGSWLPRPNPGASERIGAAFGLRQLERDLDAALLAGVDPDVLECSRGIAQTIASCVAASGPAHEWTPLALSALRRLEAKLPYFDMLGDRLDIDTLRVPIQDGAGFEGLFEKSNVFRSHDYFLSMPASADRSRGLLTVPEILLLAQDPQLRREGLRLGADPDALFASRAKAAAKALTQLGASSDLANALVEARHLGAHADQARMNANASSNAPTSQRPARI